MATTLRLDEALYREAKAAAAKRGITITRWIEEALRAQLARGGVVAAAGPVTLHTVEGGGGLPDDPEALKKLMRELDDEYDRKQMRIAGLLPGKS